MSEPALSSRHACSPAAARLRWRRAPGPAPWLGTLHQKASQPGTASNGKRSRHHLLVAAQARKSDLNLLERAVNAVTVAVTNSPLHEGKKRFFIGRAGRYDEAATRARIEQLVSSNPVVVFSWTFCPFAQKAKALLAEQGARYTAVELDREPEGKALRAELAKMTNRTSVPNVFIGGRSYGGCNDGPGVRTLHEAGQLLPLLQQAGAL